VTQLGSGSPRRARIDSIDLVRGPIIIVMALDHSRDFFGDLALCRWYAGLRRRRNDWWLSYL
jgi:uncharacterized membrane protein